MATIRKKSDSGVATRRGRSRVDWVRVPVASACRVDELNARTRLLIDRGDRVPVALNVVDWVAAGEGVAVVAEGAEGEAEVSERAVVVVDLEESAGGRGSGGRPCRASLTRCRGVCRCSGRRSWPR